MIPEQKNHLKVEAKSTQAPTVKIERVRQVYQVKVKPLKPVQTVLKVIMPKVAQAKVDMAKNLALEIAEQIPQEAFVEVNKQRLY